MVNQSNKSDVELGRELKSGKQEAFGEAVERFIRPIYSICLKCLRDPVEAQDATQDVFLRMYKGINTFDPEKPLSSWLFRIAYNRCIDYLKKRGKNLEIAMQDVESVTYDSHPPLDSESTEPMKALMWAAVDELNETHRLIILFKYRFNMKNGEIAEVFSITENNLRVKLYRAKQELRSAVLRKLQEG